MTNHYSQTIYRGLFLILGAILLLLISGCKSAQLKTLESSISQLNISTGKEIVRYTQDAETGFTGPVYAEIFIQYEPLENYSKEELYNEIVGSLKKNGWQEQICEGCEANNFSATLLLEGYPIPINALVHLYLDENLVSIRLTHPKP